MEHIIYKHILNYLESHNSLSDLQHGSRSRRSCETQLITTIHYLMSSFNKQIQTNEGEFINVPRDS